VLFYVNAFVLMHCVDRDFLIIEFINKRTCQTNSPVLAITRFMMIGFCSQHRYIWQLGTTARA